MSTANQTPPPSFAIWLPFAGSVVVAAGAFLGVYLAQNNQMEQFNKRFEEDRKEAEIKRTKEHKDWEDLRKRELAQRAKEHKLKF